jgi:hypothetical protein
LEGVKPLLEVGRWVSALLLPFTCLRENKKGNENLAGVFLCLGCVETESIIFSPLSQSLFLIRAQLAVKWDAWGASML